ncbi:MAG: TRAP transporter large permease [Oscillospiraceae bacterium]|nr:TRAP transporter large permease [Oscillospiraceae bacterium]
MSGAWLVFVIFFVCLFINIPIAFSLGIAVVGTILVTSAAPMTLITQALVTSVDSFTLLAIPFFVLAGDIMATGGISQKLVNFGKSLFGNIAGSLGIITVFCCAVFAAISGSGPATVAAIGGILIPYMIKDGYERPFAATLAAVGGCLGPIIPPSISFIMFGVVAGVSITDLFLAGVVPGLLITVSVIICSYIVSKQKGFGVKAVEKKTSLTGVLRALNDAKWALLMPIIILGGIYGGVFSPTEASVVACVYGLIISIFVHRELKIKDLGAVFGRTAMTIGSCLVLVTCAKAFGELLTLMRVPANVSDFIQSVTNSPAVVLLLINILLLIVGCFMDPVSAILILAPLLIPIAKTFGIDLIHFGAVMVINLIIGQVTPPVGINLFIGSKIAEVSIEKTFKWLPLFLGVLIIDLMLITYIPALSTWLVQIAR